MKDTPNTSPARQAFLHYLRTGRRLPENDLPDEVAIECKFNPYHNPDNGQFTFAPGGPRSSSSFAFPGKRVGGQSPGQRRTAAQSAGKRPEAMSGISLTRTHREFLSYASKFPAKPGTEDTWTKSPSQEAFKDQFISGHSNAIRAAANKYDVPAPLVASIAYRELGNDNAENDLAYAVRAEGGRKIPRKLGVVDGGSWFIDNLNRPRDETSFGPYNIQQRRAAQILEYGDINKMSETARRTLIPTTRDPIPATFMLAKHLSDLRKQDFPGVAGKNLKPEQIVIIAARYRAGPDKSLSEIRTPDNIKHGKEYLMMWSHVKKLLR